MTDLEALVVAAYVFADEYPVALRGGRRPLVSDAELVALAVAQAAIGISSDRQFLGLIGRVLPGWFPHLPDQSQYNRRLRGLVESVNDSWPLAIVQTCVLHLVRNTFRYASKQYWYELARDLRSVYTAATEQAARERFDEFAGKWGERYPAIIRLWENAWAEFVPFLAYSPEIRKVLYSTNAIESVHARLRRSVRARGHFPTEQAAMKCLYLAVRSLDPTGRGQQRWSNRWKPALNAFAITFEGRDRTPSFGPGVMRVLVGCRSFVGVRTRQVSCSRGIGVVGSGCTRAASRRGAAAPRAAC